MLQPSIGKSREVSVVGDQSTRLNELVVSGLVSPIVALWVSGGVETWCVRS